MPRIIKHGAITDDSRPGVDPEVAVPAPGQICTLEQWLQQADKRDSAVQLESGQPPSPLLDFLDQIELVVINFPVFTDGRGFSYARELRQRGYSGELRAGGHFIRDQLTFLHRCGFDAFQMPEGSDIEAALASLGDFTEHYQAAIDQPLPLFRRRDQAQT